MKEFLPISRS